MYHLRILKDAEDVFKRCIFQFLNPQTKQFSPVRYYRKHLKNVLFILNSERSIFTLGIKKPIT